MGDTRTSHINVFRLYSMEQTAYAFCRFFLLHLHAALLHAADVPHTLPCHSSPLPANVTRKLPTARARAKKKEQKLGFRLPVADGRMYYVVGILGMGAFVSAKGVTRPWRPGHDGEPVHPNSWGPMLILGSRAVQMMK